MYIWMCSIFGKAFYGRTWLDFIAFLDIVQDVLDVDIRHRIIIWVHNLSFEFQWIKALFEWEDVFALDVRVPVYAVTKEGVEFRCSYIQYGAGLATMGKNLVKYKVTKAVGDLDYDLPRHSKTAMTAQELHYCLEDVQVVVAYIQEQIEYEKYNITKIPLTKTGYPRRLVKRNMLYGKDGWKNKNIVAAMTFDKEEFLLQRWEFAGGFTHGNHNHIGKVMKLVDSKDETSAYPYVILAYGYPHGKGMRIKIRDDEHFRRMLKTYCCLFQIRITNVRPRVDFEHIISSSKCRNLVNAVLDNGRVVTADSLEIACNEVDFECLEKFYEWDSLQVGLFYRYRKTYLPKAFIETVIKLYYDKTMLKGVEGMETEYQMSKAMLNALYGMCVMSPIRDEIMYETDWKRVLANWDDGIAKYNNSKSRFISYSWGCWVTSYARRNLYQAIMELKDDYIYSDTDSVKYVNYEQHEEYFERYNASVVARLDKMCSYYHIDPELTRPKGKQIGVWDDEGVYDRFKTLGAKRYAVEKDGKFNITVSGLNKKTAAPWMVDAFPDPFDAFNDKLYVPKEHTGKLTHTYIDIPFHDLLTDYTGQTMPIMERSCVHLEPQDYSLNLSESFLQYLNSYLGG